MRRTDAGSAVRAGTYLGSRVGVLAVWAAMAGVAVAQGQTEVRGVLRRPLRLASVLRAG